MPYDFSQLNDKEFEALSADVISAVYGVRVERFKPGRDQGVDGRFYTITSSEVIMQCKHYLGSGYGALLRKLKTEEVAKVCRLNPVKYVLVTSLPLSRANKDEIRNIFSPYIVRDDDVYGQDDLNDILSTNPSIEEKHFKLWIASATVLQRILHNAIKGRSEFEIERIQRESKLYVQTENHNKARNLLKANGVVIISGEPGIGKTTLAKNLCLSYVSEGFEFLDIEESLAEAEDVYQKAKRQIFLFDDFLGSNYFEAIQNKKDSHIVNFMDRVSSDKTKRFILTSRTNILNAGLLYSPIFANRNLRGSEYMLTISSLGEFDRALILYNHIWFSLVPEAFIDEIYAEKRYKQIIRHDNFNPRLIEFILDVARVPVKKPAYYWRYVSKTLDNPRDIWGDCFKVQSNEYVRSLVRLVVFNGGQISEQDLRWAFNRYIDISGIKSGSHVENDFNATARLAVRSFLNRSIIDERAYYELFNPSIADFVLSEYETEGGLISGVFLALGTLKSLDQLSALIKHNRMPREQLIRLRRMLLNEALQSGENLDYLVTLAWQLKEDELSEPMVERALDKALSSPAPLSCLREFFGLATQFPKFFLCGDFDFLPHIFGQRVLGEDDMRAFAEFMDCYQVSSEVGIESFEYEFREFLTMSINQRAEEVELSEFVDIGGDGHDWDIDVNRDGIRAELRSLLENTLEEFKYKAVANVSFDPEEIVSTVDIDEMVDQYVQSSSEPDYEGRGTGETYLDRSIEDLFERT